MANVSQLQPAINPQVQTSSVEAQEKDADFLALRLINRRTRLRLSPQPLDIASVPGRASLFVVVNSKGWFAAVTRDAGGGSALILSPLLDLRSAFSSASTDEEQSFKPQRRVPISGTTPHNLTVACNDSRLLLGMVDGSIHVHASEQLFSAGEGPVQPIHVFTTSSSAPILSVQPNPGDISELVAVLRDCTNSPGSLSVELLDVQKFISAGGWMAGKSPSTTPTSISWSPKGKQLALGLQSGDIVTFSPTATATPKSCIPHPPSANNMSVISMYWLSTTSFHTIYAPPGKLTPDVEQIHFHSSLDSKSNTAQGIKFNNPYLPFPGLRPPGEFLVCLRGWDPSKVLLFIGDSTSSDIGLIGSTANGSGESWHNFSLEETSTPSLPLDKDQNDTILLGMDVDLTDTESYRHSTASGEALQLPAHPIMYAYASDGTMVGWHILNVTGSSYPGMVTMVNTSVPGPGGLTRIERELSSDMQMTPTISPTTSTLVETSATKPLSAVFSQPSPFGTQGSTFSTSGSVFGQPPAFGQAQSGATQQPSTVFSKPTSLGQPATTSVFGLTTAPSAFESSSTPRFGSVVTSGFGAFGAAGPAKFGQTTFGFGDPLQTTSSQPSASVPEESMASDETPSLSGLGLGAASSQASDSKPSIFGKPSVPVSSTPQSSADGLIKPGAGFGAFGGFDQKSPFAKPTAFTSSFSSPTPALSAGAFSGLQTTPSFVKPPSGFFGELPKESPFFAPPTTVEPKPVSAFALSATPNSIPPKTNLAQPTFGASSMPGGGFKSAFPPVSATPAQPPPASSSGAFSAFSSSGGGFAAFSSAGTKSFSDLLRTNGDSKPSGPTLSEETPTKPAQPPPPPPVSTTPVSAAAKEPPTPFPSSGGSFAAFLAGGTKPSSDTPRATGEDKTPQPAMTEETPSQSAQPSLQPSVAATPVPAFTKEPPKLFSTGAGGFAAFASGGNKSFSDLLRTAGDKSPAPLPSEETPGKPTQPSPQPAVSIGGGGGFAAFSSGGNKSFGDLLRTAGDKPRVSTPSEETPSKPVQPSPQPTVLTSGGGFAAFSSGGNKSFGDLLRATEDKSRAETPSEETPNKPVQPSQPAVSTSSGGFAAFSSGGNKSFGDLLRTAGDKSQVSTPSEEIPGKPAQPSLQPAISTGGGGFAAFSSGGNKSFGDLLRTAGDKSRISTPSEETPSRLAQPSPQFTVSTTPVPAPEPSKPFSTFGSASPQFSISTTPVPAPEPSKSFSTFGGGFAAFSSGSNKSFGELLRTVGDKSPAPTPSEPPSSKPVQPSPQPSVSVTPPVKEPPKLFPGGGGGFGAFSFGAKPSRPQSAAPSEAISTKLAQVPLPTPPSTISVFTLAKEPVKPSPTPPVAPQVEKGPRVGTGGKEGEEDGGEDGEEDEFEEEGEETGEGEAESGVSELVSESEAFEEEEESEAVSEAVEEEVGKRMEKVVRPTPMLPLVPVQKPPPTPEEGMQSECTLLSDTIKKELENLKQLAVEASLKMAKLQKTSGIPHQKSDLGDCHKWTFGDIKEYGRLLVDVQVDVKELKAVPASLRKVLKELDSNMLKLNTRKEEITRFNKAKTDADFTKMLKIRTLAPEYAEMQSQLRKSIRVIKDRVQKLEDHLQASKKRIHELRTGRPILRPPSLDTVNRTFHNIDIAIEQQRQDISQLWRRMAGLEISGGAGAIEQFAVSLSKRPLNVTPNVAVTTAAALNAERSAQRFKKALLASRSQPLLNTTAVAKTPVVEAPKAVPALPAPPTTPAMSFPSSLPAWTPPPPPEFASALTHDLSLARNRGGTKHHQKPIALKKSGSPAGSTTPPPSLFEWKPVEPIRPASSLPFALRPAGSS